MIEMTAMILMRIYTYICTMYIYRSLPRRLLSGSLARATRPPVERSQQRLSPQALASLRQYRWSASRGAARQRERRPACKTRQDKTRQDKTSHRPTRSVSVTLYYPSESEQRSELSLTAYGRCEHSRAGSRWSSPRRSCHHMWRQLPPSPHLRLPPPVNAFIKCNKTKHN